MKIDISYSSVAKVMGQLLLVEGGLLLIPLVMEIVDREPGWRGFVVSAAACLGFGGALWHRLRDVPLRIGRREGFMLVGVGWVVFSLLGMIPYLLCAYPLSISDAFFETMSGFTTTGATTIADVEVLSKGILLWRSMTQWIGGLGIILFMLAVLPSLNERGGISMYNAETTGITHDKLRPRIRHTASCLWGVYGVLTLVMAGLLWAGPMDLFDSICHSLTAISTGGFSTRNQSIAYWNSNYVTVVLTVFMFLGGVNFALLYGITRGDFRSLWRSDVLRGYVLVVAVAYLALFVTLAIEHRNDNVTDALVNPLFHVVSTITTTGYTLADFSGWGPFAVLVTFLLMLSGACAGSTTGAIKIDRIIALARNLSNEVRKSVAPRRVYVVRVNGNVVSEEDLARVSAFATIYMVLILVGGLVVSAYGIGLEDSFFAVISCLGNNGLGYGLTGASGGYHLLPDAAKWLMSLLMLTGRLELFSVLVMFFGVFWRK